MVALCKCTERADWFNRDDLKWYVQFEEELFPVLCRVLRNAVIAPITQSRLQELNREIFPDHADPVLLILRHIDVRVEIFERQFEVVTPPCGNIGFDQAGS